MGPLWRQSVESTGPRRHEAGTPPEIWQEWWAVQVWTGREATSAIHLRQRGYEVFLPCYQQLRRWSDRVKKVDHPLFDGYLFCLARPDVVSRIITVPGVIRIVGNGTAPIPVAHDEMQALQRLVETRLDVEPWPFLQAGQRVRVNAGPLSGVEGRIVTVKGHRLVISVSLLQRSVAVELPPTCVEIGPSSPAV